MYKLNSVHLAQLGGQVFSLGLFQLGKASYQLWTWDAASPVVADLIIPVVIIDPESFHQLSQSCFVFRVSLCEGDGGAGLPVDWTPQPGLPLDDAVGNAHLLAQGRQEDHQLDGTHIVYSHHQLSLLVLLQGGDSVNPCWKDRWPLGGDFPLTGSLFLSPGLQPLLLSCFVSGLYLWASVSV